MEFKLNAEQNRYLNDGEAEYQITAGYNDTNTDNGGASCPFPLSSFLMDEAGNLVKQAAKTAKTKTSKDTKKKISKSTKLYANTDWKALETINTDNGTSMDFKALATFEGGSRRDGYPPPTKESGVTVDTGFDLGLSKKGIEDYNFSKPLEDKLVPYAGLKGQAGTDALKKTPLLLTDAEANEVTQKVQRKFLKDTMNAWDNRILKGGTKFKDLTPAQQTILMSRTYHQGPGMPGTKIAKPFYKAALAGDWEKAEQELRDYGGTVTKTKTVKGKKVQVQERKLAKWYQNRVKREADVLKKEREAQAKT